LLPEDEIRELTVKIINQAVPCNGFIIGITEDVPKERAMNNYAAIMDGIDSWTGRTN
jgi:uncharacterized protein YneR